MAGDVQSPATSDERQANKVMGEPWALFVSMINDVSRCDGIDGQVRAWVLWQRITIALPCLRERQ